jgi:hypothetical protein
MQKEGHFKSRSTTGPISLYEEKVGSREIVNGECQNSLQSNKINITCTANVKLT